MKKAILAAAVALTAFNVPAHATMPPLTPLPAIKSKPTCLEWAGRQKDDDTVDMWGTLEDGKTSESVAARRLANYCMTGKYPPIVTAGGSAGEHDRYCKSFPASAICDDPERSGSPPGADDNDRSGEQ